MKVDKEALAFIKRLQRSVPIDITGIANVLGLNVWESETLPGGIAGKLFRDERNGGESRYSIVVRAQDPLVRKRFTVAHEIAHYLLHRNLFRGELIDDALYRSTLSTPVEAQANAFAAELLMPRHLLDQFPNKSARELAELFQVSEEAMNIRLEPAQSSVRNAAITTY